MMEGAVKTEPRTTRTRNSRKWKKSRTSQNKGKQTAQDQNFPRIPPKENKARKAKFENKSVQAKDR